MSSRIPTVYQLAKNQTIIYADYGTFFQSYSAIIAYRSFDEKTVVLNQTYWNMFSQTTNKYLLKFLNHASIKEVRAKVHDGTYQVVANLQHEEREW